MAEGDVLIFEVRFHGASSLHFIERTLRAFAFGDFGEWRGRLYGVGFTRALIFGLVGRHLLWGLY